MGREVKRVPVDFDWPLDKVWQGYLMPEDLRLPTCQECDGSGTTAAAKWVESISMLLLMLGEDARTQEMDRPLHPYLATLMNNPGGRPSADAVALSTGLAGRPPGFLGHDAIDRWTATAAIIKAAGLPEGWGHCPVCTGSGHTATAEQEAAHEAWESTGPPEGEGWQLWETVSEGSPISPVFATAEDLAEWMTRNKCTVSGPMPSYDGALRFVRKGWAPSLVSLPDQGVIAGTEWVGADTP